MNETERGSYANMANTCLDYFCEETDADTSNESMRILMKETAARFIQQPSSEVASQATGLLKSESVGPSSL